MKIAIPCERRDGEGRVAASPETVKKFVGLGAEVAVESGAGAASAVTDAAFQEAGARIEPDAAATLAGATVVLKVQRPLAEELSLMARGTHLVATLDPMRTAADLHALAKAGICAFAMDLMPRITRAQSMDVLSSQANLAGYKSVLDAGEYYTGCFPMMTTAAGTIHPAKVLVMGAGVAGLQAIATAKRLGGVVSATDVRPAAKEQVMSLGAKFLAVEDEEFKQAEAAGGYAKEMSAEYQKKQAALIAETIAKMDIVITTAQIPGRPAPRLVSADMVASMKPGSVLVDLAVETGGNIEGSVPGEVVDKDGVLIVGHRNVPNRLASVASQLYARNLFNFLSPFLSKDKGLEIDWEDDVVTGTLVTKDGQIVQERLRDLAGTAPPGETAEGPDGTGSTAAEAGAATSAASTLSAAALATAAAVQPSGSRGHGANDGSLASAALATAAAVSARPPRPEPDATVEAPPEASAEENMAVSSASDRVLSEEGETETPDDAEIPPPEPGNDTLQAQSGREQIAFGDGSGEMSDDTSKDTQA